MGFNCCSKGFMMTLEVPNPGISERFTMFYLSAENLLGQRGPKVTNWVTSGLTEMGQVRVPPEGLVLFTFEPAVFGGWEFWTMLQWSKPQIMPLQAPGASCDFFVLWLKTDLSQPAIKRTLRELRMTNRAAHAGTSATLQAGRHRVIPVEDDNSLIWVVIPHRGRSAHGLIGSTHQFQSCL